MSRRRWTHQSIKQIVEGENPFVQFGYTGPVEKFHNIGEEWIDGKGNTWRKIEGGKVRVNKQMDAIRELVKPRCKVCRMDINLFGDKVDQKIFARTQKCFSCLDIEEQTLKVTGKYEEYENKKLSKNRLSLLREFQKNVIESIAFLKKDDSKVEMVCSNGDIVKWEGGPDVEPILKEAESDLVKVNEEIKRMETELAKIDSDDCLKVTA